MNKMIYWISLGLLSGAIFFFGAFGLAGSQSLDLCLAVKTDCTDHVVNIIMNWCLALICFWLQIKLTKKGWGEK